MLKVGSMDKREVNCSLRLRLMSSLTGRNKMITLRQFTEDNAHRFWSDGKHLEDCKQQIYAFCSFGDHDNRSISEFKAADVFKFTDSLMVAGLKVSTINRYKCAL